MILLDFSKIYFDKYTNFYEKKYFLTNFHKETANKPQRNHKEKFLENPHC